MKKKWLSYMMGAAGIVVVAALAFAALRGVGRAADAEGRDRLEAALRQAAVACYASEGIYPPTVDYLQAHYGIQIDGEKYAVDYRAFADNLMPSITVLEREP